MVREDLRNGLAEFNPDIILFDNPSFDNSIVGLTEDNNHIIYDFNLMVQELSKDDNITEEEAMEFIDYNTIRALPYCVDEFRPIIMTKLEGLI